MAETNVFFLTSYLKKMLIDYKIFIQGKNQKEFYFMEKGEYIIFINEINLPLNKEKRIEIIIENEEDEKNIYNIKNNFGNNTIFLFNYELDKLETELNFIKINYIFFWTNDEKYINENFSAHEKFSFFYRYLLSSRDDIGKYKLIYYELINAYLKEIKDDKIPIDIGISILIIFQELKYFDEYLSLIKKIDKKSEYDFINLKEHENIFLKEIINCLQKLLLFNNKDKYLILEIITIYFIKYKEKDIEMILLEKCL